MSLRVRDCMTVGGFRLPSVTTWILSQTKDTSFLTKWKAKVGEAEAENGLRMYLVNVVLLCTRILKNIF